LIIAVLKETAEHEKRVALSPEVAGQFVKKDLEVWIEKDAGLLSNFLDPQYEAIGAKVVSRDEALSKADVVLAVQTPELDDLKKLKKDATLICFIWALQHADLVASLKDLGISALGMDAIPRISRAQNMDALSSMSSIAGYKASLVAANELDKYMPMMMTAAGTIPPSKALILGAGVAGLQAIATCRKLGAVVEAFDVRSAVKEEVQSLGAKFVEVEGAIDDASAGGYAVEQTEEFKQRQSQLIQDHAIKSDVVICTAQIPGRKAPVLIIKETVESMKSGSVIIDLAASTGGNCELTENDKTIDHQGVRIVGNSNYAAGMPVDASRMYGKNLVNFLKLIMDEEGNLILNFEDEIVKGACITHQGEIVNERVKSIIEKQ